MGSVTHGPPREFVTALRRALSIDTFVETGTFRGGTAIWAAGEFATVYTVELSEPLYQGAIQQLHPYSNVICEHDDARQFLPRTLARISAAIFWLDAHWSGGWETAGVDDQCPLLDELRVLAPSLDRNVILIDDARLFQSPPSRQWPDVHQILAAASPSRPIFYDIFDDVIVIARAELGSVIQPIIASYQKTSDAQLYGSKPTARLVTEESRTSMKETDTYRLPSSLLAELLTELKNYSLFHNQALAAPVGKKFLLFSTEFYQAGHKRLVGGFADRLKGMLSSALLAMLTNRIFLVEWVSPVALAEHFDPVNLAWGRIDALAGIDEENTFLADAIDRENFSIFDQYIEKSDAAGHLFGDRTLAKIHTNILSISNLLRKKSLLRKSTFGRFLERCVQESSMPVLERELFRILFSYLLNYRPQGRTLDMWNDFHARRRDGPVIGVHFRSGGDPAWSDGAMDDAANASLVADTVAAVAEVEFQNRASVLIASDSARVRSDLKDLISTAYLVLSYAGEIYHYERSGGDPAAGSDFAVFEFMCLSCCDYVIHGTGGYALTAALVGGRPSRRYDDRVDIVEFGPPPGTALLYPAAHARLEGLALGLWGEGVANRIEGPLALISWQVACTPGSYEVWLRYAAAQERPVKLLLDGGVVAENALIETTGGWGPGHQHWRFQVRLQLDGSAHTLGLTSAGATPHISALALVCRADVDDRLANKADTWLADREFAPSMDVAELGVAPGTVLLFPVTHARLEGLALGIWGAGIANRTEGQLGLISWQVACRPGTYEVWVRYAAAEERRMRLLLDDRLLTENALIETTGGWQPAHQRWWFQICIQLEGHTHTLELASPNATPHVSALALIRRDEVDHRLAKRKVSG